MAIGSLANGWVGTSVFASLAGGIVFNVITEELPENRRSRYWLFAVSAAVYAAALATS